MRLDLGTLNESIRLRGFERGLVRLRRHGARTPSPNSPVPDTTPGQGAPRRCVQGRTLGFRAQRSVVFEHLDGPPNGSPPAKLSAAHVYTYDEDAELIEFNPLAQLIPNAKNMERVLAEFDDTAD